MSRTTTVPVPRKTSKQSIASAAATKRRKISASPNPVQQEDRQQMIATAAYFRAERRGFNGGDPVMDWLNAEVEIDSMLRNDPFNRH